MTHDPQTEPLPVARLITGRCRDLRLSQADLVRRSGYSNIPKGLRRLEELLAGDLTKTKVLIEALPAALSLPAEAVLRAVHDTQRQLDERRRQQVDAEAAAYRAAFQPHAVILTERTVPSPMFVAAVIGPERLLRVDFDARALLIRYSFLALEGIEERMTKWGGVLPGYGRPVGFVVNYEPDSALRFNLEGRAVEALRQAHRIPEVSLLIKGRPIPTRVWPHVAPY
jgi:hypothetical protein